MAIVVKSELERPYVVDLNHPAASLLNSIYLFADAGAVGTQPVVIPDLCGKHDINMFYGDPLDGITVDGDLLLSANFFNSGNINTYGELPSIDATWSIANKNYSSLLVVKTLVAPYTHSQKVDYLLEIAGNVITKNADHSLNIKWTSGNGHGLTATNINAELSEGDPLCIVIQLDRANEQGMLAINGIDYSDTLVSVGYPWVVGNNSTPRSDRYIGRHSSWANYYGWQAPIKFLAFGLNEVGSELTAQQVINFSINPYSVLKSAIIFVPSYTVTFEKTSTGVFVDDCFAQVVQNVSFDKTSCSFWVNDAFITQSISTNVETNHVPVFVDDIDVTQAISANFDKNVLTTHINDISTNQTVSALFQCNTIAVYSAEIAVNQSLTVTPEKTTLAIIVDDFSVISELLKSITLKNITCTLDAEIYGVRVDSEKYQFTLVQ